ncbi:hypothetical protein D1007_02520 [Hordeum vulgare]|nr:hypothetical protein D1007_02520 [Hordeum vulgare]
MTGRGAKQQSAQHLGHPSGQATRPPAAAHAVARAKQQSALPPGRPSGQVPPSAAHVAGPAAANVAPAVSEANRMQQRGRWGDDEVNVYGDGHHRGSSSTGGGRGYAWQGNGGSAGGFASPPGKFVSGVSGPPHPKRGGFKQN